MIRRVQALGRSTFSFLRESGRTTIFLLQVLFGRTKFPDNIKLLIIQLYYVGVFSLLIVVISGMFIGMVLGLQGYTILVKFGAVNAL